MVTRIYLPSSRETRISPAFDASWGLTTGADRVRAVVGLRSGTGMASKSTAEASATPVNVLSRQYIVGPLKAVEISGTVKGRIRAQEANADADYRAQIVIRVLSSDGGTVRGTLRAADTEALSNEFGTSLTNRAFPLATLEPQALSPVTAQAGDWLVIEIGYRSHNAHTTSRNGTFRYGDSASSDLPEDETSTSDYNPWIEFSQDIAIQEIETRQVLGEVAGSYDGPIEVRQVLGEVAGSYDGPIEVRQVLGEVAGSYDGPIEVRQVVAEVAYLYGLVQPVPHVHGCIIPNAAGRAVAEPEYGDRASWRTDYDDGATHADDWVAGDSHHPAVTLGEGSAEELALDGQELTLAEVLTPTEHTAIGDAPPHHPPVTLSAEAADVLALSGQELGLDTQATNTVLAGPTSGAAAAPTFRALSNADLPDPLAFKTAASALGIVSGAVTATQNLHTITSETGTTDDLTTITAAADRTLLVIQATATHTITVKHGTGNISLNGAADFVLSGDKALLLYWNGTAWVDLGAGGAAGALANHDHSGDAGDGGTFDAANLASSAATDGQVLTADGSGGAAWEDAPGSPLTVEEQDGAPSVGSVEKIKVTNGTLTDEGNGVVKLDFGAAATDGSAIHDNVAEEIHAITEKATPADDDELLIEDSADDWAKKRVKMSNLPGGGGGATDVLMVQVFS